MSELPVAALLIRVTYLLGSLSDGVLWGRLRRVDGHPQGSGDGGQPNVLRVLAGRFPQVALVLVGCSHRGNLGRLGAASESHVERLRRWARGR